MSLNTLLPDASLSGEVKRWYLPINAEFGDGSNRQPRNGAPPQTGEIEYYSPYARFLGVGTSHTEQHQPHNQRYVPRGIRCNACRWFEARIFRELLLPDGVEDLAGLQDPADVALGEYIIHSAGMSIVTNEVPLLRYETTRSPFMVIELMTTRRTTERGPEAFLAKPSAHALAEAVQYDSALQDAYVNRAVS